MNLLELTDLDIQQLATGAIFVDVLVVLWAENPNEVLEFLDLDRPRHAETADVTILELVSQEPHVVDAGEVELNLLAVDVDRRADGGELVAGVDGNNGVDGLPEVLKRLNEDVVVWIVHLDVAHEHVER